MLSIFLAFFVHLFGGSAGAAVHPALHAPIVHTGDMHAMDSAGGPAG